MLELALHHRGGPLPLKTMARHQGISAKYLEQLLIPLKGAGMVKSVRGARGGYLLAMEPGNIRLSAIVRALEGPVAIVDCVEDPDCCSRQPACVAHILWKRLNRIMEDYLDGITLEQLVESQLNLDRGQEVRLGGAGQHAPGKSTASHE